MTEPDAAFRRQRLLAFAAALIVALAAPVVLSAGQPDPLSRAILSLVASMAALLFLLVALAVASYMGREGIASGLGWGIAVALLVGLGVCFAPGL